MGAALGMTEPVGPHPAGWRPVQVEGQTAEGKPGDVWGVQVADGVSCLTQGLKARNDVRVLGDTHLLLPAKREDKPNRQGPFFRCSKRGYIDRTETYLASCGPRIVVHWFPLVGIKSTFSELSKLVDNSIPFEGPTITLPTDTPGFMMLTGKVIHISSWGFPMSVEWHPSLGPVADLMPVFVGPNDDYETNVGCYVDHMVKISPTSAHVKISPFLAAGFTAEAARAGTIETGGGLDILMPRQHRFIKLIRAVVIDRLTADPPCRHGEAREGDMHCRNATLVQGRVAHRMDEFYWKVRKELFDNAVAYITENLIRPTLPAGQVIQIRGKLCRLDEMGWMVGVPATVKSSDTIESLIQFHFVFVSID